MRRVTILNKRIELLKEKCYITSRSQMRQEQETLKKEEDKLYEYLRKHNSSLPDKVIKNNEIYYSALLQKP